MPQALHLLLLLLQDILVAGKPHLGTDRLVRILRRFREHLLALGVQVHFGACATDFAIQNSRVTGVQLRGEGAEVQWVQRPPGGQWGIGACTGGPAPVAMRSLSLRTHANIGSGTWLCSSLACRPASASGSISSTWRRCRILCYCRFATLLPTMLLH